MIIDTDVLIWYLRGNKKATGTVVNAVPFAVSIVTCQEFTLFFLRTDYCEELYDTGDTVLNMPV